MLGVKVLVGVFVEFVSFNNEGPTVGVIVVSFVSLMPVLVGADEGLNVSFNWLGL